MNHPKPTVPLIDNDAPARNVHTWGHLSDSGLLWYINRALFHPLGYALSIDGTDETHSIGSGGWSLHYAGGEVIRFGDDTDEDAKLAALNSLLATARIHGVSPADGHPFFGNPR